MGKMDQNLLHFCMSQPGLTVSSKDREGLWAGLLKVTAACTSGEGRGLLDRRDRLGDDIGAVDELVRVVADNGELGHGRLEVGHHEALVVNHALPFTSSALKDYRVSIFRIPV